VILDVIKPSKTVAKGQSELVFRQRYWGGERQPYPLGTELVLALTESAGRLDRSAGPFGVFGVQGDTVRQTYGANYSGYDGMRLDDFLLELGRLVR
jgi:hypothetical protein